MFDVRFSMFVILTNIKKYQILKPEKRISEHENQNSFINSAKEILVTSKIKWGNIPKINAKIAKG